MRSVKQVFLCAGTNLTRLFCSSKCWLILVIVTIFSFYIYTPMCDVSSFYQIPTPPWLFPFYLSWYQMLLVHCGLCLLLFVDAAETDGYVNLMLVRCGRLPYILGYLVYVLAASFLYTFFVWLLSILFVLPVLGWDADWGVLIRTLVDSSVQVQEQTGVKLSFIVSHEMISLFTPLEATLISFLCLWISMTFVGVLICFFRLVFNKTTAVIVTGVLIGLSLFVRFMGGIFIGEWLNYLSPLTWSNMAYIDWYYSGSLPSPVYVFSVWFGGIAVMGVGAVLRFCRGDLD